jgi:hypothetical protein
LSQKNKYLSRRFTHLKEILCIRYLLFFTVFGLTAFGQEEGKELGLKTINKQVIQAQLEFLSPPLAQSCNLCPSAKGWKLFVDVA